MKGDFTRSTFRPDKHYSGVRMQQGRVQLDADWNEQLDIVAHRTETEAIDVIGGCGAPMHYAGFSLTNAAIPKIGPGRYYVDGILCENDGDVDLDKQPDLPVAALSELITPKNATVTDGLYIAYLEVWQRHITALEDEGIREVALGGPDTATRTKTIWQVKLLGPLTGPLNCLSEPKVWTDLLDKTQNGRLSAQAAQSTKADGPCVVPPGAGYRRLENQLYRVEIHAVDATGDITLLKWSRDNGSIVTRWLDQKATKLEELIVQSIGRDGVLSFGPGQYVEVIDDQRELRGEAGILVKLANAEGQVLTLDMTDPNAASVDIANFPDKIAGQTNNRKARRWDGTLAGQATGDWRELEDGVQIKFETGEYHVGDYWLIPARTAAADVEWPRDNATPANPIPQPRAGIEHHCCKLAIVSHTATGFTVVQDCRRRFPPLTELTTLLYVGGDGQEAMPGNLLPQSLRVRVVNGPAPVEGAQVQFTVKRGGGNISSLTPPRSPAPDAIATTTNDGIAECAWILGRDGEDAQQVDVVLLDAGGSPVPGQVLRFSANWSIASQVAYDPANCSDLAVVRTVQEAIDALCQRSTGGGCCVTVGQGGQFESLDQALADLLGNHERDICLCLLHGDHGLSIPEIRQDLGQPDLHIKISGAGLGSRVHLVGPIIFSGVRAVTLRDLAIGVEFTAEGERGAMAFDGCGQVSLTGCAIAGRTTFGEEIAGGTLVSVADTASLRLRDVRIEARTEPTFRVLLEAIERAGASVLLKAMDPLDKGGLEFRRAALQAGAEIVALNSNERTILARQLKALSGRQELGIAEQFVFQKMRAAVTATTHTAEDYAAIIIDLRRAAIKARPGVALVLAPLPQGQALAEVPLGPMDRDNFTSVESCEISGEVGLYGLPVTPSSLAPMLQNGFLADLQRNMRNGQFSLGDGTLPLGTLELRGNQLLRIGLAMRIVNAFANQLHSDQIIGFFNELLLTDNIFEGFPVAVAALHCGLASNQFQVGLGQDHAIGAVFGQSGVYTGNRGQDSRLWDITQVRGDAANVHIVFT